jgi:hypothetical protein
LLHERGNKLHDLPLLTGSHGESGLGGDYVTTIEADPLGVNVGVEDPFIEPLPLGFEPSPETPMIGGLGGGGCSSSNPNCQQCYLDGARVECVQVTMLSEIGAAVVAPSQTVRWNPTVNNGDRTMGAYEFFHAFNNGYSGWMTSYGYNNYEGVRSQSLIRTIWLAGLLPVRLPEYRAQVDESYPDQQVQQYRSVCAA